MDCKTAIMTKISMDQLNQWLGIKGKNTISDMRTQNILFLEGIDFFYYVFSFFFT